MLLAAIMSLMSLSEPAAFIDPAVPVEQAGPTGQVEVAGLAGSAAPAGAIEPSKPATSAGTVSLDAPSGPAGIVEPLDTLKVYDLPAVVVNMSLKHNDKYTEQPSAVSSFTAPVFEPGRINEPKNLSLTVPNFMHADYGSKMTGSIYIRGIGSRIDQPAVGLYVDNVPVLDKNNYDFDYYDIQSIDVLRGPQGTLYGRNTSGGLIDVHSISPFRYQGVRARLEYGNGNTSGAGVSVYQKPSDNFAYSVALNHRYSGGFFTNEYDGSPADRLLSESGRVKVEAKLSERLFIQNTLSANYVDQDGFAYGLYDERTGSVLPVNHNDPCGYRRFSLSNGVVISYLRGDVLYSSATSYQYLDDVMTLDQDFLPESMFTLRQSQRENAVTQEFTARSIGGGCWKRTSGLFGFYKNIDMKAPVTFKRDGIDELILSNANAGIHTVFPDADLLIREEEFVIGSDFTLPAFGVSAYHQSVFDAGRWSFTAGVRADFEHTSIRYDNSATINYRFTKTMPEYRALPVEMSGSRSKSFFEVMPKAAVMYKTATGNLYVSVARGYKAGGFNTQIFSNILQSRMMNAMMEDLEVYIDGLDPGFGDVSAVAYKPEYSWNYEAGAHFKLFGGRLAVNPVVFLIDCRNQQLTVFPPGKTTGRLMSNAGRSRIMGAELTAGYRYGNLAIDASYGCTHAVFVDYIDGPDDFSGNRVPYAPANTVAVNGRYALGAGAGWLDKVVFEAGWTGAGRIYWNESNTLVQPFYGMLNAAVSLHKGAWALGVWGRNLTGTVYNTFYFHSMGNSFLQRGKPVQVGIFINFNI